MPGPSEVDKTLHASPSGAAAYLASAHSAEHALKLYGGWFCPFVQRAWITLVEKRIPHQYVEINPYHKAADFLALNPRGLVPTLAVPVDPQGKGKQLKPLYESLVVCEYLDEAYADTAKYGRPLLPEDAYERARCRLWIDHVSTRLIPSFYRFIQHTPDKSYSLAEMREEFVGHLKTFVREMVPLNSEDGGSRMDAGGPWFLGDRFSLVDVMLAPWAMRLFLIEHYKKPGGLGIPGFDVTTAGKPTSGTKGLPNGKTQQGAANGNSADEQGEDDDTAVWERWRVWYNAITTRQSVKDTWSDDAQYIEAYKRYAEDTTGSQVGHATRGGGRLP